MRWYWPKPAPTLSQNPAFANATHGVGIAAKIGECAHAKKPADYGSGPGEIVIVVGP